MTGEQPDEQAVASARRPTPNPASRARRIGGRPTTRTSEGTRPRPAPEVADGAPVSIVKPERTRPAPAPERPRPARERGLALRWIPACVLGLAVIALLAWWAVASHGVYWAQPDNSASGRTARQEQVLAAAKKCFAQINTYDYRKLDGLVQRDVQCTTGTFSSDLTRALQSQIIPLAPKLKAIQTAQVNRAGIASVSPDGGQVVTLMYGQLSQTNVNTGKNGPRIDVVGAVVTMTKVGGRWLVSKVDTDVGNVLGGS